MVSPGGSSACAESLPLETNRVVVSALRSGFCRYLIVTLEKSEIFF